MKGEIELIQNAIIINGKILNSCNVHDYRSYTDKTGDSWFIDGGLDYIHTNIIGSNKGFKELEIEDLTITHDSTIKQCYQKMLISVYPQEYYTEFVRLKTEQKQLEQKEYKTKKAEDKRFKDWKRVTAEITQLQPTYFSWKKICELTKEEVNLIKQEQSYILEQFPLKKALLKFRETELNDKNYN